MGFIESIFEEFTEPILHLGARRKRKEKLYEQIALEEFKLRMLVNPPRILSLRGGKTPTPVPASVAVPILGQKLYDQLMRDQRFDKVMMAGGKGSPESTFLGVAFQEAMEILGFASSFDGPFLFVPQPIDMHALDDPDKLEAKLNDLRAKYSKLVRTVEGQRNTQRTNEIIETNRGLTAEAEEKVFDPEDGGLNKVNIEELKKHLREYAMGRGNMVEHQAAIDQLEQELFEFQYNNYDNRIKRYREWKDEYMQRQKTYGADREKFNSRQAATDMVRIKRGRPKKGERFVSGDTIRYIINRLINRGVALVRLDKGGHKIFRDAIKDNPELWIEILAHLHLILKNSGLTDEEIENMLVNAKSNDARAEIVGRIINSTDPNSLGQLNDAIIREVLKKGNLTDAQRKILEDNIIGKITPEKPEEVEGIFGNETVFNALNSRIYERLSALGMDSELAQEATLNLMTIFKKYQLQDIADSEGIRAGVDKTIGRIADALDELDRKYKSAAAVPSLKTKAKGIVEKFFAAVQLWRETQSELEGELKTPQGIADSLNKLRADIETTINALKGLNPPAGTGGGAGRPPPATPGDVGGSGGAGTPPDSLIPPGFLPPTPGPVVDAGGAGGAAGGSGGAGGAGSGRPSAGGPGGAGGRPSGPTPSTPPADVPVIEESDEEMIRELERMLGIPPEESILPLEVDVAENAVAADGRNPGEVADDYIAGLLRRGDLPDDNLQANLNLPIGRRRVPLRVLFRIAIRIMGYAAGLKFVWNILKNIIDIFLPPPEGGDPWGPPPDGPDQPIPDGPDGPDNPPLGPDVPTIPDDDEHSFVETPPATGSIAADVINPAESILFNQNTREAQQEEKDFIKFSIVPPLNNGLKNPLIFADYMNKNKRFTNTYPYPKAEVAKAHDIPRNKQPQFRDIHFDVSNRKKKNLLNQRQDGGYNACKFTRVTPVDPMDQQYKHSIYYPDEALVGSTRQPYYGDTLNFSRNDGADRFAPRSDPFYQGGYANQRNIEESLYKSQKYNFNTDAFYSVRGQLRRR